MRASSTLMSMMVMRFEPSGNLGNQLPRQRQLVGAAPAARQFARALGIDEQQRVVVLPERRRPEVADDQRHVLADSLLAAHGAPCRGSLRRSRRSTAASARAATSARMSGFSVSAKAGTSRPAGLLDLLRRGTRRRANRPRPQWRRRRRAPAASGSTASCICCALCDVDAGHAARRRQRHRAGHQRHARAGLGGGACDRRTPSCRSTGW